MNERPTDFGALIASFLEERLTDQERQELEEQMAASPEKALLFQRLCEAPEGRYEPSQQLLDKAAADLSKEMGFDVRTGRLPVKKLVIRYLSAAAFLAVAVCGIWLVTKKKESATVNPLAVQEKHTIPSAIESAAVLPADAWMTVSTKDGKQRHVRLPDGSSVLLNAASTLRYPTVFKDNERRVSLNGEGYFDVSADKEHPFLVDLVNHADQAVQALGTGFNVYNRKDMPVNVTLVQGSLQCIMGKDTQLLRPMEMAEMAGKNKMTVTKDVDTLSTLAWKSGLFAFTNANVRKVMTEIAFVYNVDLDIKDKKGPSWFHYRGTFKRDVSLEEALKNIGLTGLKMELTQGSQPGKRVIVVPAGQ